MLSLFAQTKAKFVSIEVVVANAGLMETKLFFGFDLDENGDLKELAESHAVIDVNLKGTMNSLFLTCLTNYSVSMVVHQMGLNSPYFPDGSRGSIVLVSSTSGYIGGTAVASYVASEHGFIGLLHVSQSATRKNGVCVNAAAPFFTPTHITSGHTEKWRQAGLPEIVSQMSLL